MVLAAPEPLPLCLPLQAYFCDLTSSRSFFITRSIWSTALRRDSASFAARSSLSADSISSSLTLVAFLQAAPTSMTLRSIREASSANVDEGAVSSPDKDIREAIIIKIRKTRRNFTILRHAIDAANSAENALIHA
jgi:hypothetical protein